MMKNKMKKPVAFVHSLLIVLSLVVPMIYGLVLRPVVFHQQGFNVSACLLIAISFTTAILFYLGFDWEELQHGMVRKVSQGIGNYLILLSIGILIAAWTVSGTIPMLIYYGACMINARFIYVIAFILSTVFAICTGISWSSVGTIGIVLIGVGATIGANLPVLAGAIVAGAVFGDKLSPLSDTTNIAALAAEVNVYSHIATLARSTVPAAVISAILYLWMGKLFPPAGASLDPAALQEIIDGIRSAFAFHPLLLLPPVLVLLGALRRWPTVPTLICSSFTALLLCLALQQFTAGAAVNALITGVTLDMFHWLPNAAEIDILSIFVRGGMHSMLEPVIISWLIFLYMGLAEQIDAMKVFINRVFAFAQSRISIILSTMAASFFTLFITGNGYAGALITADVFHHKFDERGIPRTVLSKTIEDGVSMFDPMIPWGATGIYMAATLGVPCVQYMPFILLSWCNTIIAILMAALFGGRLLTAGRKRADTA